MTYQQAAAVAAWYNQAETTSKEETCHEQSVDSNKLSEKLNRIAETLQILSLEIHDLSEELQVKPPENSGEC